MISLTKNAVYVVSRMLQEKKGCGIRVKKKEGCCSVFFDIHLDRKNKEDRILNRHGSVKIFADPGTMDSIKAFSRKKILKPTTIDHVRTHFGPSFFTENHMVSINIREHDIE